MSIKFSKVLIQGKDLTSRVVSINESDYGYRICFRGGACTFNKSEVSIYNYNSFDVGDHELSDKGACIDYLSADRKLLAIETSMHTPVLIDKKDAIAIAKALGVTWEDLL